MLLPLTEPSVKAPTSWVWGAPVLIRQRQQVYKQTNTDVWQEHPVTGLRTLAHTEDQPRYQLIVPKRSGKIRSPKTEHPVSRSLCRHTDSWASLELQQGPLHGFALAQEACGREWKRHRCEQYILPAFKDHQTDATNERNHWCGIFALCFESLTLNAQNSKLSTVPKQSKKKKLCRRQNPWHYLKKSTCTSASKHTVRESANVCRMQWDREKAELSPIVITPDVCLITKLYS